MMGELEYEITKPNLSDFLKMKLIGIICLPVDPSTYIPFLHFFKSLSKNEVLVAKIDKRVVGYIYSLTPFSDSTAHLQHLCVLPRYQSRGVGTSLLRELIKLLKKKKYKKIELRVFIKNHKAINFYRKFKFKKKGKELFNMKYKMQLKL